MKTALIAGQGQLPRLLARQLAEEGTPVICALEGQEPDLDLPLRRFRLETLGSLFERLRAEDVTRVCLAGAIHRPALDPARVDAATMPLVPKVMAALRHGDDGALRVALTLFEDAGFAIVGADAILPALLPPPGVPTRRQPGEGDAADAARGMAVLEITGAADIGQACVVAAGQVLAMEALPGTDAMLATLRDRPAHLPGGGLLCKAPKPGQDRRVDLPTIGAETLRHAAHAGLDGIAIAARGVLFLDAEAAIAEADRQDMFIWIRET